MTISTSGTCPSSQKPDRRRISQRQLVAFLSVFVLCVVCIYEKIVNNGYRTFLGQSPQYYAGVAGACDVLIKEVQKRNGQQLVIPWSDNRVPKVLRDLRPEYLEIDSYRAYIMVGAGRSAYAIIWQQANSTEWRLSTVGDTLQTDVYTNGIFRF